MNKVPVKFIENTNYSCHMKSCLFSAKKNLSPLLPPPKKPQKLNNIKFRMKSLMTWNESLSSVKISHSNGPPMLEFDLSSERLLSQHPVHVVFATKFLTTILESISCNNVAPVTNLCLGRATTRSHSSQWSKKKVAVET